MKARPFRIFARLVLLCVGSLVLTVAVRAAELPELFAERVKSVVAVEFFTESELDRRPSIMYALVADNAGTLVLPPQTINSHTQPSKLKDFRVYLPGRPVSEYSAGEYLGQDPLSDWHFVRVEEKLRVSLVPVTAFKGKATESEPRIGEEFWGIGLRGKDEDFTPYVMASRVSLVKELPERTAFALAEVAAPGLPVFDRAGAFAGVGVAGFGQTYYQYSRHDRNGTPVMLMNMEESSVFHLAVDVLPWLSRVPKNVFGRPLAWLGTAGLQPMDPEVASFLKLGDQSGAVISEVLEGSPAEAAGLKNRDIVVALDGKPLPRFKPDRVVVTYLERQLAQRKPGDTLEVTVLRGSERVEAKVTLGEQPKLVREADRTYFDRIGFTAREFINSDGVQRRVKQAEHRGVVVSFVKPSSPAAVAGLRWDDWILEVDGTEVKTYAEAVAKLSAIEADTARAEFVLLTSRNGETSVLRVKLK